MLTFENAVKQRGYQLICGVDEAGRGPLAGPVFAAAVILPELFDLPGLNDSKKLSEKKREELFPLICTQAVAFCVASADEGEIDELNILNASLLAMKRAIEGLKPQADFALIDGNQLRNIPIPAEAIVKGDSRSASIAAASVLAKVSRDRYMLEMDKLYPEYLFFQHKGYPTALHYDIIKKHGICPIHRKTFLKKVLAD